MSSPVVLLLAWIVAKASAEGKRPEPAFQLAIAFVDAWSLYMWTSSPQFVATHAFRDALRVCLEIEPFPRHCEERLRRSNPVLDSRRHWIASLALAMTEFHVVTPRACRASSAARPIVSTTDDSGILDRPLQCAIAHKADDDSGECGAILRYCKHAFDLRGAMRPGFCLNLSPSPIRGRRGCRVPNAPTASCALWGRKNMRTSLHSGSTGNIRHPPRDGLRLIPRSPRGPIALLTPSSVRRVGVLRT